MTKMTSKITPLLTLALVASSLLYGCGGGGDSTPQVVPPPIATNQSPTVSITADTSIAAGEVLQLAASGSDTDGTIVSYSWSVTTGEGITLSGADSGSVSFTAPDIDVDTVVTLTVSVTDNDGATGTQDISITIISAENGLTITGLVTDKVIPNAIIEITIGEQVFSATADENGIYSIRITIDESSLDQLVKIQALGDSSLNPEVEFVSQLGSLTSLIEQAGDTGVLISEGNFGVNITNVTTAEYALLTREGATFTSEAELNTATALVNTDEKNTLAALIKIVVDNDDYDLPAGVTSTLNLVSDSASAAAFEQDVIAKDPTLITETINQIVDDNSLTGESEIVGTWKVGSDAVTFMRSGHYVHISTIAEEDDCGQIGYEVGTYTWNEITGSLSVITKEDSNGCYGLHDDQSLNTINVKPGVYQASGNTLTIDEGEGVFTAQRLVSESNPFIGGFYLQRTNFSDDLSMLITLDDDQSFLLYRVDSSGLPSDISYLLFARDYSYDSQSSLRIIHSQKVYVDGEVTSERTDEVWRALITVQGDVISMTRSGNTSFLKNSSTTTTQEYLSNDNVIGNFSGTNGDDNFNVSFNEDGTGQGSSDDGGSSLEWKVLFGQLLIMLDDGSIQIWSPTNLVDDIWQFTVTNYDENSALDIITAGTLTSSDVVVLPPPESSIVGTWMLNERTVITFTDSGHYIHMEINSDDCGFSGYELGTYIWEENTGEIQISTQVDTNGCIGFHDDQPLNTLNDAGITLIVDGNTLQALEIESGDGFSFSRIIDTNNPLIGGYYEGDFNNGFSLSIFLDESHFMELMHQNGEFGMNMGRYSWNATTTLIDFGEITLNQLNDTYDQGVVKMQGDILIWKDDEQAGVMKRTQTTTEQPYFTESDILGSYSGKEQDFEFTLVFNNDHTAQEVSNDGVLNYTWRVEFGQLLLDDGWLLIASPVLKSPEFVQVDIADFNLEANTDSGETGTFEYWSSSWIKD
jgi:hypothetical protein